MMLIVNGKNQQVQLNCTAEMLLKILNMGEKRLAMEVNEEILPRSQFTQFQFKAGDRVEIVQAIGGG